MTEPKPEKIDFESINEPWLSYKLADGNIFQIRPQLIEVTLNKNQGNPGEPPYHFQIGAMMRVVKPNQEKAIVQ